MNKGNKIIKKYRNYVVRKGSMALAKCVVKSLSKRFIWSLTRNEKIIDEGLLGLSCTLDSFLSKLSCSKEYRDFKILKDEGFIPTTKADRKMINTINCVLAGIYDCFKGAYDACVETGLIAKEEQA